VDTDALTLHTKLNPPACLFEPKLDSRSVANSKSFSPRELSRLPLSKLRQLANFCTDVYSSDS
jgi:hypothetical protein